MSTLSDLEMTELAEACWKDGARGWRAEVESIIARHVTAALAAKADEIEARMGRDREYDDGMEDAARIVRGES